MILSSCSSTPSSYPSDCEITEGLRKMAQHKSVQVIDERIAARAEKLQLLLLDVDGVLTNGTLIFSSQGEESKGFNTQDGFGIRLMQEIGVETGIITARKSTAVTRRCENLQMRYIYQGDNDKLKAYNDIIKKSGLKPVEIGYMGDDWLDLVLFSRVGLALAPANAVAEVKDAAHYITSRSGGDGAVREVCDMILKAKGLHKRLLQSYCSP